MNTQKAPFNDLKVRQAINYAIDPEAFNRVFGGRLHPTQQILSPGMPGYEQSKLYPGPDMAKAKQLLAEANPTDKDISSMASMRRTWLLSSTRLSATNVLKPD